MSGKIINFKGNFAIRAVEYSNVATGQEFGHQGVPFLGLRFGAWYAGDRHLSLNNSPSVTLRIFGKAFFSASL